MDFILMDIKNFLKKLENGQLEIEAGQWELHRDISNMRKMVNELKSLKEELGKMRMSSQQQMGLIKELQDKFHVLQKMDSEDHSAKGSAAESENLSKDSKDQEGDQETVDEEYEKENCRLLPSDDILEIASHASKVKSESSPGDSDTGMMDPQGIDDDVEFTMERLENSCSDASRDMYMSRPRKSAMKASEERLSSPHYITSSTNQDILHRYLQDSAKYLGQKTSGSITFEPSATSMDERECSGKEDSPSFECDECSSVLRVDSEAESREDSKTKMSALWKRNPASRSSKKCSYKVFDREQPSRRASDKRLFCRTCGKDFPNRSKLKKHAITHWMAASATNGKGFKCSYCKKICPTPEALTQHLRKCRIITRSYNRMK